MNMFIGLEPRPVRDQWFSGFRWVPAWGAKGWHVASDVRRSRGHRALQGITELFPISSLGHAVLIPAIIGGQWAQDLDVSTAESPYLAFIVGLHVATATAMIIYFWRDWVRIIRAFFASIGHMISPAPGTRRFQPQNTDQMLAWMIILATIPVGLAGVALEHTFRTVFSKPLSPRRSCS
jgi:Uncharacterized bacitracin resistance protein